MKILRLARFLPPKVGGLEYHVEELSRHQARMGHELALFFEQGEAIAMSRLTCVKVAASPATRYAASDLLRGAFFSMRSSSVLGGPEYCRDAYDLVHSHGDVGEIVGAVRMAKKLGCPLVHTVHGGLSRQKHYRFLASRIFQFPDLILAVSENIKDDLCTLGVDAGRVKVFSSGVDCERIQAVDPAAEARATENLRLVGDITPVVVITVGRLHPVKGMHYFVTAAKKLLKQWPQVRFVIVGEGSERSTLESMIDGDPRIILTGQKDKDEIYAMLRLSSVYVTTSVDLPNQYEGTPTSLLEGMVASLPVVATDTGGVSRLVGDGKGGFIVQQHSVEQIVESISRLLGDRGLAIEMGEHNRRIASSFDWELQAEKITQAYEEIVRL